MTLNKLPDIFSGTILVRNLTKWPDWFVNLVRNETNSSSLSNALLNWTLSLSLICSKDSNIANRRSKRGRTNWRNSGLTCSKCSSLKSIALTIFAKAVTTALVKIGTFSTCRRPTSHSTSNWQFDNVRIASFWQFFGEYQQAWRAPPYMGFILNSRWKV